MQDLKDIQEKWQKKWEDSKIFQAKNKGKKYYILEMFPYPSGSGLHLGHAFNYTIGDVYARYKLMNGFDVLHPMGYDSLGLPAENAAIKEGTHPQDYTEKSIQNFIKQQKKLGLTYDWSRTLMTSSPEYYKWDQWIFLQMLKKGLAYKKESPVNWCPKCNTVLANEQVHNGKCWRHEDTNAEIKHLSQWYFKITDYAEELNNMQGIKEWPEIVKKLQKNWIGKSTGTKVTFKINNTDWEVFTTRPDTLMGVTFLVISAQHPRLPEIVTEEQKKEVDSFVNKLTSVSQEEIDQLEKEGIFTGAYALHPLTGERVPVYAGNFVLAEYGSGMVMAVPAHDQRDFEFAKKYNLRIKQVITPKGTKENKALKKAYTEPGELINSGEFNGIDSEKAKKEITKKLNELKLGQSTINFRLRDWLVSRQRYWGTPIPVIYCEKCGIIPVPEEELPIELPYNVQFGEGNPLKTNPEFLNCKCHKCGGKATRETDTMDTFVNSSWYQLRYTDPKNKEKIFDKQKANHWNPVDFYIGGKEHSCMHLIYIRFYTKFLRDLGLIDIDEPAVKLFNQGMLHGTDGNKMSKSIGNVIDPLETIDKYGTDSLRMFSVSVAGPDSDFNWSDKGIQGIYKLIKKIQNHFNSVKIGSSSKKIQSKTHKTIKNVTEHIESLKYNLAIIQLRELVNSFEEEMSKEDLEIFLKLITPFTPHIAEELWNKLGNKEFISTSQWPQCNEKKIDQEAEYEDEFIKNVTSDIQSVLELAKVQKPKKITLFIAEQWKHEFVKKLKSKIEETRNIGEIIKSTLDSKHDKQISKLVPAFVKNPTKIPETVLSQKKETQILSDSLKKISQELNIETEYTLEQDTSEPKAKQAMPGKPAILVE